MVVINACDSIHIEELSTTLTALDAGHCPGSLLFLLEHGPTKLSVLHTGDMRASEHIRNQPLLAPFRDKTKKLDALYLDTTYANPKYDFPAQVDACDEIKRIVREELRREPKTLFLCNTYSVGKENAFDAVVDASGGTLFVPPRRAEALRLCDRWRSWVLHSFCAHIANPRSCMLRGCAVQASYVSAIIIGKYGVAPTAFRTLYALKMDDRAH